MLARRHPRPHDRRRSPAGASPKHDYVDPQPLRSTLRPSWQWRRHRRTRQVSPEQRRPPIATARGAAYPRRAKESCSPPPRPRRALHESVRRTTKRPRGAAGRRTPRSLSLKFVRGVAAPPNVAAAEASAVSAEAVPAGTTGRPSVEGAPALRMTLIIIIISFIIAVTLYGFYA